MFQNSSTQCNRIRPSCTEHSVSLILFHLRFEPIHFDSYSITLGLRTSERVGYDSLSFNSPKHNRFNRITGTLITAIITNSSQQRSSCLQPFHSLIRYNEAVANYYRRAIKPDAVCCRVANCNLHQRATNNIALSFKLEASIGNKAHSMLLHTVERNKLVCKGVKRMCLSQRGRNRNSFKLKC